MCCFIPLLLLKGTVNHMYDTMCHTVYFRIRWWDWEVSLPLQVLEMAQKKSLGIQLMGSSELFSSSASLACFRSPFRRVADLPHKTTLVGIWWIWFESSQYWFSRKALCMEPSGYIELEPPLLLASLKGRSPRTPWAWKIKTFFFQRIIHMFKLIFTENRSYHNVELMIL